VGDVNNMGLNADLVKKAAETGFDGIKNLVKD
jgi:hypothetical protein